MRIMCAILLCAVCGCARPSVSVSIISIEGGDKNAHYYTLQSPYTVVEENVSKTRRIMPGVLGDVGDTFFLDEMPGELP